jgi:hypothetical protein
MAIGNLKLAGIAAGAGAAVVGTILLPTLGSALKSLTKSLIKGGLLTYQGSKGLVDKTTKAIESIAAQARAEMQDSSGKQPSAKKPASKPAPKSRRPQTAATP